MYIQLFKKRVPSTSMWALVYFKLCNFPQQNKTKQTAALPRKTYIRFSYTFLKPSHQYSETRTHITYAFLTITNSVTWTGFTPAVYAYLYCTFILFESCCFFSKRRQNSFTPGFSFKHCDLSNSPFRFY